jgi:hypothetical protein
VFVSSDPLSRFLANLEEASRQFGPGRAARIEQLLASARAKQFRDAASLIRFHEALMFTRAFPHSPRVLRQADDLLADFHTRVGRLRNQRADVKPFDPMEVSGIAGTAMQETLTFDEVRWLVRRIPGRVEIDWDDEPEDRALAATLHRFFPLLDEDGLVEADTPWPRWLAAARGREDELQWLVQRFEQLPISGREKSELYDSLHLAVRWELDNLRLSRTRNVQSPRDVFYQAGPLLTRRDVSLAREFAKPAPILKPLPRRQAEAVINMVREVMIVRHRELYGTTLADPASVVRTDVGRGVTMFLMNLPADRRLPLRAYAAGFTLKNGVPINYFEANALFEWVEVGFNTFYTFRDGETAWVYAQVLRCLSTLMGARCISVYPYQIGHKNEEAIESGAFWFYRKLGFRPGHDDLMRITEREEAKMLANPRHRTSAQTLRRLAEGHMFYEMPGCEPGAWHRFSTRNLGLAVNKKMAQDFAGNSNRIRQASTAAVARVLDVKPSRWKPLEQAAFENFALVLALVPDLTRWQRSEKQAVVEIIRAKVGRSEMKYLRLMQRHPKLRAALLKLGSRTA